MQMDSDNARSLVKQEIKRHKRRCLDYTTTILAILVWCFLVLSDIVLLYFARVSSKDVSESGEAVTSTEIAGVVGLSALPILLATIFNEVLVERCWRRVTYCALGDRVETFSDEKKAKHLRAANFGIMNFLWRMLKWDLSWQDARTALSYALLRWGTAASIASVQLCVSWKPAHLENDTGLYTADRRYVWVFGPLAIHVCCIFGTMSFIWLMPPWRFFSDRFNDYGLLERYMPYLEHIRGGSIVTYDNVAKHLLKRDDKPVELHKKNRPGIQFRTKLKGVAFGLLLMNVPPAIAWAYFQYYDHGDVLRLSIYRFALHLVFLAQNIFYLLALDFVIWNLSLEGFCKTPRGKPNANLRHLGYSSGMMLFLKMVKQRRPIRACIFIILFWIQACLMRFLTVLYVLCVQVLSYGNLDDRDDFYNPQFWLSWVVMTAMFIFPLFILWLFTEFQAPICEQDGWRWAKIAQYALLGEGFYGVRSHHSNHYEAAWGTDVMSFNDCRNVDLR